MIGWLMDLFRRHDRAPDPDPQADRLERRVNALDARQQRAAKAADQVMDRELRLAYQAIVGDRRRDNVGHYPERRRGDAK